MIISWQGVESINEFWLSSKTKVGILCEDSVSAYSLKIATKTDSINVIYGSGWKFVVNKLTELQETCSKKQKRLVGFIDKDYWFLNDTINVAKLENIVTTDMRDIEIDLLNTDALLDFISCKKPTQAKNSKSILSLIFTNLRALGLLRAYNHANQKSWSFASIEDYVKNDHFDYSKWLARFRMENKITENEFLLFEKWAKLQKVSSNDVIRGHDAIHYLQKILGIQIDKPKTSNSNTLSLEDCIALSLKSEHLSSLRWVDKIKQLTN